MKTIGLFSEAEECLTQTGYCMAVVSRSTSNFQKDDVVIAHLNGGAKIPLRVLAVQDGEAGVQGHLRHVMLAK